MPWIDSFHPRRFGPPGFHNKLFGIRELDGTAADIYRVLPTYRRISQKYNALMQPEWRPDLPGHTEQDRTDKVIRLVKRGVNGYSLLDWSFMTAADANLQASRTGNNVPNRGASSWGVLGMGHPEELPRWEADPRQNTAIIKRMGYFFGADQVGIATLDRRWVYSHYFVKKTGAEIPIRFSDEPGYEHIDRPVELEDGTQVIPKEMKYVIVFIHEMNRDGISMAPTLFAHATTRTTYSKIAFITASMAEFLRGLGYNAIASANETALNTPLAIDAGLGQLSRQAKLINPTYGPRCRISKVFTDMPLFADRPIDFGVTRFCNTCLKCARACPRHCIPTGPPSYEPKGDYSHNAVLQWQMDHMKCREYFTAVGTNCGLCLVACPYNKPPHWGQWFMASLIATTPLFNRFILWMDDRLGYGKRKSANEFWARIRSGKL